jgi:hypothetical protein
MVVENEAEMKGKIADSCDEFCLLEIYLIQSRWVLSCAD